MKQPPRRTCVGCRTARAKPELVRIAATPDGVVIDAEHRVPGRGAYVCPERQCIETIQRADGQPLRRALRTADQRTIPEALSELHRRLAAPHGSTPAAQVAPVGPASRRSSPSRSTTA